MCLALRSVIFISMDKLKFISVSPIKVQTALHLLHEAGIRAYVIDKLDSAHPGVFGHIEIIVDEEMELEARIILKEAEILDQI